MEAIKPFRIEVQESVLDDLKARLAKTRWPDAINDSGWEYGSNLEYVKQLAEYWLNKYNWRQQESFLNGFSQFEADAAGSRLHFIYEKGKGNNPMPIMLIHGWPDSFYRMHKLIPMLTNPEKFGGNAEDAFDVVVPSIPGYGFSEKPSVKGFNSEKIAGVFQKLMTNVLGYQKYGTHGGDWGSSISEQMALGFAESLIGIHITEIPYYHLFTIKPENLSEPEKEYLEKGKSWQMQEGAYAMIQSTKPQTLAYGLNDSPTGLLAWIIEKFQSWSDCGGDIESRFTKDELLTNVMIYWVTETINSANRLYYESQHSPPSPKSGPCEVPTGVAIFPKDLVSAPKDFADKFFNITRWTEMQKGGHFAALEEPELLAKEIRAFFHPLRKNYGTII